LEGVIGHEQIWLGGQAGRMMIEPTTKENFMVGWWYTYPSEKYETSSVGIMKFPIYGKS